MKFLELFEKKLSPEQQRLREIIEQIKEYINRPMFSKEDENPGLEDQAHKGSWSSMILLLDELIEMITNELVKEKLKTKRAELPPDFLERSDASNIRYDGYTREQKETAVLSLVSVYKDVVEILKKAGEDIV